MTLDMAMVLTLFAATVTLFVTEKLRVDLVAMLLMSALLLTGLVTPEEGVAGFANPATVTVARELLPSSRPACPVPALSRCWAAPRPACSHGTCGPACP